VRPAAKAGARPGLWYDAFDVRVLIDYRAALRARTGTGEYIHHLTRAIAARHASALDLTVFSSSWKDRLDLDQLGGIPHIDRRIPVRVLNLAWHRAGWPPIERLAGARFDIAHSNHPLVMPARHAAQIVTIHDLDFLLHPERTRAEIRRDYPALARDHAHRADAILVPSQYVAGEVQRLLDVPSTRIFACSPGAPPWPARASRPTRGYLLFVGTLEPRKNVGGLLRAYAALLGRRPDAPDLVLVGGATSAAAPWLEAIARAPLRGRVRHLGYVGAAQLVATYTGAAALVLPSFEEGFGFPVLEAMTLGVPVVASNRGSLPGILGEAGLLVDPEDDEAVAAALERITSDEQLARECATRGIARARAFTWERAADVAVAAYAAALGSSS
jgi:glycosyltransferase involved in cell wall biosynthesis